MRQFRLVDRCAMLAAVAAALIPLCGCAQMVKPGPPALSTAHIPAVDAPRELQKAALPQYVIEPPDVLDITAIHVVPKAPYHLRTLDALAIHVLGTLPDAPIAGAYPVEMGGLVQLGPAYGSVKVDGLTVEQAEEQIVARLEQVLRDPEVSVTLAGIADQQQISGPHLVGPDGRVNLGTYGGVNVTGLTVPEARAAIETRLSRFLDAPEVAVRVTGYNSKSYYIITQGAGLGDSVARFPVTGNETVLDAISNIGGFTVQSSHKIWIARPGRNARGRDQILPVDWQALARVGEADTNYQLMPGDRLYIAENKWVALDNNLAILAAPFERAAGFAQLMVSTVSRFSGNVLAGGAANRFGGGFVPVFVAP